MSFGFGWRAALVPFETSHFTKLETLNVACPPRPSPPCATFWTTGIESEVCKIPIDRNRGHTFAGGGKTAAGVARRNRGDVERGAEVGTSHVAGIEATVLSGDPTKSGLYTIRLSVPARTTIQAHSHRDERSAVVVSAIW